VIALGCGCNKLLCLLFVVSLQLCNNWTQACKLWQQQLCAFTFYLRFVTFKLGHVALTMLLCICFLLWVKGWACGNNKLLCLLGNNKLLHLLRLVATTSFSTYLRLMQQEDSIIIFYYGLKVCSIQT
jgi:hypothetical protein